MLALLFPGQGSQEVGMGRDVADASPAARRVFEAADDALGLPLSRWCFEGPEDDLLRTEIQQPAILTTSIALLRALEERGPTGAAFVGGHSLGEYSALVAAGAVPFDEAVRLVHARGRFMQEAVPEGRGAMAAVVGLDAGPVSEVCAEVSGELGEVVTPANLNSPQQTVIAGTSTAVERACSLARERGARHTIPLSVSAPFHSPLMSPAAEKLELELARIHFSDAVIPVITNVEALPNQAAARMPGLLKQQVTSPVRFCEMLEKLIALGVTRVLEVGPGRVLTGLVGRVQRRQPRAAFGGLGDLDDALRLIAGD